MEALLALIGLALAGWVLVAPLAMFIAFGRRVAALERQLATLRAQLGATPATAGPAASVSVSVDELARVAGTDAAPEAMAEPIAAVTPDPLAPPLLPAARQPGAWAEFETWLVRHWIVAAGGVTAALGGLFLVRYSVEQGLLGPTGRVLLGAVVGLALITGAEALRRRLTEGAEAPPAPGLLQVPAALAGAGLVTLYGVAYAAHALYDMMPAAAAFVLLAGVAAAALAAGLLYGPLSAALGTGLALLAPALVASDRPDAAVLFLYLFAVSGGVFALVRHRDWPWLVWLALGGNGLWHLLWAVSEGGGQALPRALHLLALPTLSAVLLLRERWPAPDGPWWRWDWRAAPVPVWTVGATVLGALGLLWLLAAGSGFDGAAALAWGVGLALLIGLARWTPTQAPLVPIAGVLTVALVAAWSVPEMTPDAAQPWFLHGPLLPPVLAGYVLPAAAYATLFAVAGFALLWGAAGAGMWAGVSAALPLAVLALLYARLSALAPSLPWSAVGLVLAALAVVAAERVARYRPQLDPALAAYAAAATAAIGLAAAIALRDAWLTVALALELPALAWIWRRLDAGVPGLRRLAQALAAVLIVRLVFNPYLAAYDRDMPVLLNWLAYGYGIPALACWVAARWFGPGRADRLVVLLEACSLGFATALMTLDLSHAAAGGGALTTAAAPLRQAGAVGIGWLALALGLLRLERGRTDPVRAWGWRGIGAIGLGWSVLTLLLAVNPLWKPAAVGSLPVLNLVAVLYGLPALLLVAGAGELRRQGWPQPARLAGAGAVLFAFAVVTLEVRQGFHGARLDIGGLDQAETYAYSAAWLLVALALLAGGLRWPATDLRHAGFGLLALAVAKAFLFDMAELTGLWRAASFLGLGLCLIGIGYGYQRYGRPRGPVSPGGIAG